MAVSENERGGTRLPTFRHRRIQSEVQVTFPEDGGDEKRKTSAVGLREGGAHVPESPLSLERLGRREELRSLRESSSC